MRSSAFSSFRKLYGRILLEENSELGHPVSNINRISFLNFKKNFENKLNHTNQTNKTKTNQTVIYRLPKGQYFVDIDYSKLLFSFN